MSQSTPDWLQLSKPITEFTARERRDLARRKRLLRKRLETAAALRRRGVFDEFDYALVALDCILRFEAKDLSMSGARFIGYRVNFFELTFNSNRLITNDDLLTDAEKDLFEQYGNPLESLRVIRSRIPAADARQRSTDDLEVTEAIVDEMSRARRMLRRRARVLHALQGRITEDKRLHPDLFTMAAALLGMLAAGVVGYIFAALQRTCPP